MKSDGICSLRVAPPPLSPGLSVIMPVAPVLVKPRRPEKAASAGEPEALPGLALALGLQSYFWGSSPRQVDISPKETDCARGQAGLREASG